MNTTLKLLKITAARMEGDHEFIGFFLKKYRESENMTEQSLRSKLKCSVTDYYRLALCRVPDVEAEDFTQRVATISKYTNSLAGELNNLIKKVVFSIEFTNVNMRDIGIAARDKKNGNDEN